MTNSIPCLFIITQLYSWSFLILLLFLLLLLSTFFSGSEAALMSLNSLRILFLSHQSNRKAQVINQLLQKKKNLISTILIGNNFVNIAASSVATALAISFWGKHGILYATFILTIIILIFCELIPKIYSSKFPEKISFLVAKPLLGFTYIFLPIINITNFITDLFFKFLLAKETPKKPLISEEELQAFITIGEKEGVVEKEERKMLLNVFELANTWVKEIMVPRTEIICFEENTSFDQMIHSILLSGRSRFPIYRKSIDNIIGTVHSRDLLSLKDKPEHFCLSKILNPPFFIPETKKVLSLLADFKKRKTHIALVIDEYGGIEGLVTLEDVLEEIVGDIFDEYDLEEKWLEYLPDGKIMADGDVSIREINELLHINIPHDEFQTLSGLIMNQLGYIPTRGESISYEEYIFSVSSIQGQKIDKIEIKSK